MLVTEVWGTLWGWYIGSASPGTGSQDKHPLLLFLSPVVVLSPLGRTGWVSVTLSVMCCGNSKGMSFIRGNCVWKDFLLVSVARGQGSCQIYSIEQSCWISMHRTIPNNRKFRNPKCQQCEAEKLALSQARPTQIPPGGVFLNRFNLASVKDGPLQLSDW